MEQFISPDFAHIASRPETVDSQRPRRPLQSQVHLTTSQADQTSHPTPNVAPRRLVVFSFVQRPCFVCIEQRWQQQCINDVVW